MKNPKKIKAKVQKSMPEVHSGMLFVCRQYEIRNLEVFGQMKYLKRTEIPKERLQDAGWFDFGQGCMNITDSDSKEMK